MCSRVLRTWKTYRVAKGVRGRELIHKLKFEVQKRVPPLLYW